MELNGKRVLVVGLGKSGVASALFLKAHGARVTVSDSKTFDQFGKEIPDAARSWHCGRNRRARRAHVSGTGFDCGQPRRAGGCAARWCRRARWAKPSSAKLNWRRSFSPAASSPSPARTGRPRPPRWPEKLSRRAASPPWLVATLEPRRSRWSEGANKDTIAVLEVSSFQLETIQTFRPKIAVVLNVTPDHLDRHHTFAAYVDAKARIFENQQAGDFAVLNADDPTCVQMAGRTRAQVFWFSRKKEVKQGAYVRKGQVMFRTPRASARSCWRPRFR